jgi:rod shape-determining protein MreD
MRKIFIFLTVVFWLLLDQTLLPFLTVFQSSGSLLFTFMGLFMLMTDEEDAFYVGLITGIMQDLYFPYAFGLNTLLNVLLFLGLSKVGLSLKEGRKAIPVLAISIAQGIKTIVIILILWLLGIRGNYYSVIIMPLYTSVLALFMYRMSVSYSRIPLIKKEWRF